MKKIYFAALACAMMMFASCEKLKDATSRDIKVNNVKFEFAAESSNAAEVRGSVVTRAGTDNIFTVTRTVSIAEMGSSEITEYAGKISNVAVNSSLLKITASPQGNYTVTDVKVAAEGVAGTLDVPSYTLGSVFTPPANMNAYTAAFVMKLLAAKTVSVTVSGKTDAPAGTVINISYESDLVLTASLL